MTRFFLLMPLVVSFQSLEMELAHRWKLVEEDGKSSVEQIELNFHEDHRFERLKDGQITQGKWKIIVGKERTLAELIFTGNPDATLHILEIEIQGDSLFLKENSEEAVYIKIN